MTIRHRFVVIAMLALAFCLALPLAASAGAPSYPMVSAAGAVGTSYDGSVAVVSFNARAVGPEEPGMMHQPARGFLLLTSKHAPTFFVSVQHIHAQSLTEVHFGGPITRSSDPSLVGLFAHCVAVDGGRGSDQFSIAITTTMECACAPATPVLFGGLSVKGAAGM